MPTLTANDLYAQLYDARVQDWPGELDFYRDFLAHTPESSQGILEIACGTGRVTLPLSKAGYKMTGLDISTELLEVARKKSVGMADPVWIQADMRTFKLKRKFGVVISPGHSFQFMNTPDEQVQCLEQVKRHLIPGGWLILHLDHQDLHWLAELLDQKGTPYKPGAVSEHPETRKMFRYSNYWTYEPSTQSATSHGIWEELAGDGSVNETWSMEPARLHCAFRSEIEHLLLRCGFTVEALYGDFFRNPLADNSENMIWVARNKI
jgi:SAM-dependent methyltransferase